MSCAGSDVAAPGRAKDNLLQRQQRLLAATPVQLQALRRRAGSRSRWTQSNCGEITWQIRVNSRSLEPVRLPRTPDYAGCTSWVQLPVSPDWGDPVHDDAMLTDIADRVRKAVS